MVRNRESTGDERGWQEREGNTVTHNVYSGLRLSPSLQYSKLWCDANMQQKS